MYNEDDILPALLKALSDVSDDVVRMDLQLLAQISSVTDSDYFTRTIQTLSNQFNGDRKVGSAGCHVDARVCARA